MGQLLRIAGLILLLVGSSLEARPPEGIIYNEDDTQRFIKAPEGKLVPADLEALVDALAGTHVRILSICCCAQKTNYNSSAWEPYWEGFDPDADNSQPFFGDVPPAERGAYRQWVSNMLALHKVNVDPNQCMIDRCRLRNISPWISIRMNDVHDAPIGNTPLHSRFWMENHDLWRYPDRFTAWNDRCFDYGKERVRDNMMKLVLEVLERYDMDGLELDWNRFPLHFREGEEQAGAVLLTEWMRQVHTAVKNAEARRHHRITLAVRVPARPETALGTGLDAITWAKEGLIDHLIVAPFWATTDFDIPVEKWISALKGTPVPVTAGLEALIRSYPGMTPTTNSPASSRAAAISALSRGSSGIYVFNYFDLPNTSEDILYELDDLPALLKQKRVHPITYPDISIPGKPEELPFPATIDPNQEKTFRQFLGKLPTRCKALIRIIPKEPFRKHDQLAVFLKETATTPLDATGEYLVAPESLSGEYNIIRVRNTSGSPITIEGIETEIHPELSEQDILSEAPRRIALYRQGEGRIRVVDNQGLPVPGVRVRIEQQRHAFLFGCNFFLSGQVENQTREMALRDLYSDVFNFATLPFYWHSYEHQKGETEEAKIRSIAEWCQERGITLKGHPLAWNFIDPAWLPDSTQEVYNLQMERIGDIITRFKGLIDIWDVVNEPTDYLREACWKGSPKVTAMWKAIGQVQFIQDCFAHARAANPTAILLINDFRIGRDYKRVVEKLVDANGRKIYDTIGIQSHMHGKVWSTTGTWEVLERFAPFDVPLHFTEATIVSGKNGFDLKAREGSWPSTPEGELAQEKAVVRFYTTLFSHPSVEAITWWDIADYNAWMSAPAGLLDVHLKPKPAYRSLKQLVRKDWWTQRNMTTDRNGEVRFRGFYGDYTAQVIPAGRKSVHTEFSLQKKRLNQVVVKIEPLERAIPARKASSSFNPNPWPKGWNFDTSHGRSPSWGEYRSATRGGFEGEMK